MIYLLLFFGFVLGVTHYWSERINTKSVGRMKAVSFTAGILITYLFLHLFPTLYESGFMLNRVSLVFVLVGFAIFHALEKYIYQHSKSTKILKMELRGVHTISLFVYYLVMGIVLVSIWRDVSELAASLFFVPLLLHAALSSTSFSELHDVVRIPTVKFLLSFSTLIGILVGYYVVIAQTAHYVMMGSIIGMLLYVTIVDSIPKEREGRPGFFLLGVIIYSAIIAFAWTF